jgi:tetratricopeptide (TPR) repeat protein
MIHVRADQIRIPILHVVTGLVISADLGLATAWPQNPSPGPARAPRCSEAETARRLVERDRFKQEATRMAQAGKFDETVAAVEKKLAIEREVLGEVHEDVVDSLEYLAYLHEFEEDLAAAGKALTEVLAIRERQPDRRDLRIGDARRALADLDRRAAMTPDQRQWLQQASRLDGLSVALYRQGKYVEGIGPCRKAMEIRGKLLGADHPHYAQSLNNLALLYKAMGDHARAESIYREALAIWKKKLGADHPTYATSLDNLALLYSAMGDYARAEPMSREALAIRKRVVGADHSHYAQSLDNLASLYRAVGDHARAEPTEAAIKRRLDGGHWRVVHLGTHGFFESPARVAALRAAVRGEDPSALPLQAAKPGEDDLDFALTPLLRSGVVLAGGGRDPGAGLPDPSTDAPAREDGILTAEEVQALDLRGTELVVLSACETGLGALEYGQGVLGLQGAFQAAGARAVVASLWKVEDAATSVLMEHFYTNLWDKKLPKLESLRQAQLTVLNNPGLVDQARRGLGETAEKLPGGGAIVPPERSGARSEPAQWAAFVLGGDGR